MSSSISLSFRVSADKAQQLQALSAATDRPKSWMMAEA